MIASAFIGFALLMLLCYFLVSKYSRGLCSRKCWLMVETSGCCSSEGAPPCPQAKLTPPSSLRLSAMRRRSSLQATNIQGREGGGREGGGGQACMGQKLNLSVLSLNVKRELLRSVTFYTQCLIPLCHGKQGANGEKWGEGVGGVG